MDVLEMFAQVISPETWEACCAPTIATLYSLTSMLTVEMPFEVSLTIERILRA
jgi:hypothetical protein